MPKSALTSLLTWLDSKRRRESASCLAACSAACSASALSKLFENSDHLSEGPGRGPWAHAKPLKFTQVLLNLLMVTV